MQASVIFYLLSRNNLLLYLSTKSVLLKSTPRQIESLTFQFETSFIVNPVVFCIDVPSIIESLIQQTDSLLFEDVTP